MKVGYTPINPEGGKCRPVNPGIGLFAPQHRVSERFRQLISITYIIIMKKKILSEIDKKIEELKKESAFDELVNWEEFRKFIENIKAKEIKDANVEEALLLINDFEKKELFLKWLKYRTEIRKTIRVKSTLNSLAKIFEKKELNTIELTIQYSIDNQYQGLFWDKFEIKQNGRNTEKTTESVIEGWKQL